MSKLSEALKQVSIKKVVTQVILEPVQQALCLLVLLILAAQRDGADGAAKRAEVVAKAATLLRDSTAFLPRWLRVVLTSEVLLGLVVDVLVGALNETPAALDDGVPAAEAAPVSP